MLFLYSLNKVSANLLNKTFEIHAYINVEVMTYIINLTFVSRKPF